MADLSYRETTKDGISDKYTTHTLSEATLG